jgi:hypothetical protein
MTIQGTTKQARARGTKVLPKCQPGFMAGRLAAVRSDEPLFNRNYEFARGLSLCIWSRSAGCRADGEVEPPIANSQRMDF